MRKIYFGGHNSNVPLISGTDTFLKSAFKDKYEITNEPHLADIFICVDHSEHDLKSVEMFIPQDRRILIRLEPRIVWPKNYIRQVNSSYGFVVNVGRNPNFEKNTTKWPQYWNQILEYEERSKKSDNRLAIISGNKMSFIAGELYSLRRKCIYKLPGIALYGTRWNLSLFGKSKTFIAELVYCIFSGNFPKLSSVKYWFKKSEFWLGAPENKLKTLSNFKLTIVIENSIDYMTEKLFDAFAARTIPIYIGPPVEHFGIPKNLVVQSKPTLKEIKTAIEAAEKLDYESWKNDLEKWLLSDSTFNSWNSTIVYNQIEKLCTNYLLAN